MTVVRDPFILGTPPWSEPPSRHTGAPDAPHGVDLARNHPAWQRWHDPHVWGSLSGMGMHNPLFNRPEPELELGSTGTARAFWGSLRDKDSEAFGRAQDSVRRAVGSARVAMAIPGHALHKVIDDGDVRSAFQTGATRSGGGEIEKYLGLRRSGEHRLFGYPATHPDHARPVYGYLTHDPFRDGHASAYGAHTLVLNRAAVAHRTTWTAGDSLNEKSLRASPLTAPHLHSVNPELTDGYYSGSYSPDLAVHEALTDHERRNTYLEAQIHGGVALRHVHYAILRTPRHNSYQARELGEKLSAAGVPWVHLHDDHHEYEGPEMAQSWDDGLRREAAWMKTYEGVASGAFASRYDPLIRLSQGSTRFLVVLDEQDRSGLTMGQIADLDEGRLYPPQPVASIIARGYWEELAEPVDAEDVLAKMRPA